MSASGSVAGIRRRRRPPVYGACTVARPARAWQDMAESGRRRGDRQERRNRRARLDPAGRQAARRDRGAAARRRDGARRHALCDARTVLPSRQVAALRRRRNRVWNCTRGLGHGGPQSGSRWPRPCSPAQRGRSPSMSVSKPRRPGAITPGIFAVCETAGRTSCSSLPSPQMARRPAPGESAWRSQAKPFAIGCI